MESISPQEIKNYVVYLNFIQNKLDKYFGEQKPFIFCKKGCGKCCKKQQFPYTFIEIQYLLSGVLALDVETRNKAEKNLLKILSDYKEHKAKKRKRKFVYDCPFLIDDVCSVYDYRGFVCRSFGLMMKEDNGAVLIPFCFYDGLNYSNVMNISKKQFSKRKYKNLKTDATPNVYHVHYTQLADEDLAKSFGFKFGKVKSMIDWFEELYKNI